MPRQYTQTEIHSYGVSGAVSDKPLRKVRTMNKGIKRYIFHDYGYGSADMEEDDCGDYVKFDDYSLLQAKNARLKELLDESFKLQVHYAELLNMHDGGERIVFENIEQFEERLKTVKANYHKAAQPQKGQDDGKVCKM